MLRGRSLLALLAVTTVATLATAGPVEPTGAWAGDAARRVRVRGLGGGKQTVRADVTLETGGIWHGRNGGARYGGTIVPGRRKQTLDYDTAARADLAADLAAEIEARALDDGQAVTATVAFTRIRATARGKRSRRRGTFLAVRERHRFTVTLEGDLEGTRKGTLRLRGRLGAQTPETSRRVSAYEVDAPYIDDPEAFWARDDLYVMSPTVLPLDRWPDEVLLPGDHGVRVIVLLPGDYRERTNGALPGGVLYIADSGTAEQPLLITFAPEVGADLHQTPHPAERMGESEARLVALRIFNQSYQYWRGITFRDGVSAGLLHTASDNVIDRCLWHETAPGPLRVRFNSLRNVVQRCVLRRFDRDSWSGGDTVAIQLSDEALTHNRIVSNVILNYTDSYQHTDRDGEDYGLGAGTIIDNNFMGFTEDAHLDDPAGELLCGENTIDMKMGGTEAEPVVISNNVFFGVRAAKAGCAASGSGGYAVTLHRRGTWIEMIGNTFLDVDSGVFLNAFFMNVDQAQGRIDPHLTFTGNTFSGVTSFSTAFPTRTGRVLTGSSPARFTGNAIIDSDRLLEEEPFPGLGPLAIQDNHLFGPLVLTPRDETAIAADGNVLHDATETVEVTLRVPWTERELRYRAPR